MFQKYCLAPVDAVLDETTYVASQETLGYGFVVEEVQKQLDSAQPGQELRVPFQILVPEHTKESLEADLFRDVLAYAPTDHTWNSNRTRNLELACEAIDGYILKPGAVFSFNETVGERTAEKGYKAATVYSGMESVQELGGGVCQVASTLYYCTLYADLEVVSRAVHTFSVDYVPWAWTPRCTGALWTISSGTTPIIPLRSTPRSMTAMWILSSSARTPRITM